MVVAILTGFAVTIFLRRKDEKLNEKTSMQTVRTFMLGTPAVDAVLVALGNSASPNFSPMGFTLLYLVCALMIVNMVFGAYYFHSYGE